jgi:hypothetical protein
MKKLIFYVLLFGFLLTSCNGNDTYNDCVHNKDGTIDVNNKCLRMTNSYKHTCELHDMQSLLLKNNKDNYAFGAFVLGMGVYSSGSSTKVSYYAYIRGTEGFRLQEVDSNYVEIVETNEIGPSIKGAFNEYGEIDGFYSDYVMYVPIGTIYQEYSADIRDLQ